VLVGPGLGIIAIVALVVANGFFVATEFAMVAVRRSRLEELVSAGNPRARAANDVVKHLDIYIAACQLGITMASLGLGWIGEPALARSLEPAFRFVAGSFAPAAAHTVAVAIAFALITALHIIMGELAPKGLALQKTEATALWVARPIHLFYLVFLWPTRLLNASGNGLLRLIGLKPATSAEMAHSVGELEILLGTMQKDGVLGENEVQYVLRLFGAADRTVREIMTPRANIVYVDKGMTIARFLEFNARHTYSHFPVCDATLDDVSGMLAVTDVLRALGDGQASENDTVGRVAKAAVFVPESKRVLELMEEMRRTGTGIAMVVDEFGGVSGLVTFKQIIGEIVGQIKQEGGREPVREMNDGTVQMDGSTRIRDANAYLGSALPESEEYDTIAGLVLAQMGRIPQQGEFVTADGLRIEVAEVRNRRIAKVSVTRNVKKQIS
jgi:putative hemolysin